MQEFLNKTIVFHKSIFLVMIYSKIIIISIAPNIDTAKFKNELENRFSNNTINIIEKRAKKIFIEKKIVISQN